MSTNPEEDESQIPTYTSAFPPLLVNGQCGTHQVIKSFNQKNNLAVRSSTITQVFSLPLEEREYKTFSDNNSFGKQSNLAKICNNIMSKTNVSMERSFSKDKCLTIIISGKPGNVQQAKKLLTSKLTPQVSISVQIPKEHYRYLLGAKGKKLAQMEMDTDTKITIPPQKSTSDLVTIVGTREGVERVRHELQMISDEQAKLASVTLNIPREFHPFISGPNNETYKQLVNKSGARIVIPSLSSGKNEIYVSGEKECVAVATEEINRIYEEKKRVCKTLPVEVPKSQHKYIIGSHGNHVNEIFKETGVYVEIPPPNSLSSTITLRGDSDKLGVALTSVYERANSMSYRELNVPGWLHRFIIGTKGSHIKKINSEFPKVHIELSDDVIKIEGPTKDCDQVEYEIDTIAKKLISQMAFVEIVVSAKHTNDLQKLRAAVSKSKTDSSVSIRTLIRDDTHILRIEGHPQEVANAKVKVVELLEKIDNEETKEITLDQKLHKKIIGQNGEQIKQISSKFPDVSINFPPASKKGDIVTLKGPKQEVDLCFKYLELFAQDLVNKNFKVELKIDKELHRAIIGKGGVRISKICKDTDTIVDFPKAGSPSDVIIVKGNKDKVEKAVEEINKIYREVENTCEVTIEVPLKYKDKLNYLSKISNDHGIGCRILQSHRLLLRGEKGAVNEVKERILQVIQNLDSQVTIEWRVPQKFHKFLLGTKGQRIQEVTKKYEVDIKVPSKRTTTTTTTTVQPTKQTTKQEKHAKNNKKIRKNKNDDKDENIDKNSGVQNHIGDHGDDNDDKNNDGDDNDLAEVQSKNDINNNNIDKELDKNDDEKNDLDGGDDGGDDTKDNIAGDRGNDKDDNNDDEKKKFNDSNDVVLITGLPSNCEEARKALSEFIPVSIEITVPSVFHRQLIGQKGATIQKLMKDFSVNINIPPAMTLSDVIKVEGRSGDVELAKEAILKKVSELEEEKKFRELKSFKVELEVDPMYHTKIIGRNGGVVNKIRDQYDVRIQFPEKNSTNQNIITIVGLEANVKDAKEFILKKIKEIESTVHEELRIDNRVHPRIIGAKGRSVHKLMQDFNVDIKFPAKDSEDKDLIVVSGQKKDVEMCCDHLMNLEDEYIQKILDDEVVKEYKKSAANINTFFSNSSNNNNNNSNSNNNSSNNNNSMKGFIVRDAPWSKTTTSTSTFDNNLDHFPGLKHDLHQHDITKQQQQQQQPDDEHLQQQHCEQQHKLENSVASNLAAVWVQKNF